jgi:hypothetical protein
MDPWAVWGAEAVRHPEHCGGSVKGICGQRGTSMTSDLLRNPKYWRDRAKEIQAIADRLVNQETKRTMQDIAICYEQLAQRAEERLSASRPG